MSFLPPQTRTRLLWFLTLLALTNLLINYLWRQQLYSMGLDMIAAFQHSQNLLLTVFFSIPSMLIDPGAVIAYIFLTIIIAKHKENSFTTIVWVLFNALGACLLKAFYADPRPFWSREDIDSLGLSCPQQYGNPSGHSWFSVTVGFGILLHQYGPGKNSINFYIALALVVFVPMSRMYLGAHSLNQVIQGVFFGFLMVILYEFCGLKQTIESFLKKFNSTPGHKWKKLIILLHLMYIAGFMINLKDYNPYFQPIPDNWASNIIAECRSSTPPHHLNFTMLLLNSLIVNFTTGIACGFQPMYNTTKGKIYLSGKWLINEQRYSLWVGYLMFFGIEAGLLLVGFLPAGVAVYVLGPSYVVLFVGGNVGAAVAGYLYTTRAFRVLFDKEVIREEIN